MARRRGRRSRKGTRVTPRRWLPFVALVAVGAGLVVLTAQGSDRPVPASDVAGRWARMPTASEPDALSTAWFCAGGTARGPDGPAELSVVIANESPRGTTADIGVVGSNGRRRSTTVDVPAAGRVRVVGSDILTSAWIAMTVEVLGGRAAVEREVTGPHGVDVSPCSTNAAPRWYVPSGSTVRGANEHLALFNPFPDATSVDITFATDEGRRSPRSLQGVAVPGRSLLMVPVANLPARRPEVATIVSARTGRILVDRVQIYDGTGDEVRGSGDGAVVTPAPEGLASTSAMPSAGTRWLFPDALKSPGTRTQVAIFNPGRVAAEVDLVVTYERPDRFPEVEPLQVTVRAGEEQLVDLTDVAEISEGVGFTIDVRSLGGVPVVAEQLVFGAVAPSAGGAGGGAGPDETPPTGAGEAGAGEQPPADEAPPAEPTPGLAVVPGSPLAASAWLLPSRGTNDNRDARVVVANPGPAKVTVRVEQLNGGTRSLVRGATVTIPAGDRRVLDLGGAAANPALLVRADGAVVVGHASVVATGPGVVSALATPLPDTLADFPPIG